MSNDKTMQAGSNMHRILSAMPPRAWRSTGELAATSALPVKNAHAYLQLHAKRGNVTTKNEGGWRYWRLTTRGRQQRADAV